MAMEPTRTGYNASLNIPNEDVRTLELLRTRLTPLVSNLEQLYAQLASADTPPSWPTIHRHINLLRLHLKSLHEYLNTPQRPNLAVSQVLASLRTYPIPPFPVTQQGEGLIWVLTRKKLEPRDENYIEERLRTAAKFCFMPENFDIEPPKSEDGESGPGEDEGLGGIRRVKSRFGEDDFTFIWREAATTVLQLVAVFQKVVQQGENGNEKGEELAQIEKIRAELGEDLDQTPPSTPGDQPQQAELPAQPPGTAFKFAGRGRF